MQAKCESDSLLKWPFPGQGNRGRLCTKIIKNHQNPIVSRSNVQFKMHRIHSDSACVSISVSSLALAVGQVGSYRSYSYSCVVICDRDPSWQTVNMFITLLTLLRFKLCQLMLQCFDLIDKNRNSQTITNRIHKASP